MPIDIATGVVSVDHEDISLPGRVDMTWNRRYSTALLGRAATLLGVGWTSRYFATLSYRNGWYEYVTPDGGLEAFADPNQTVARGGVIRQPGSFLEIFRQDTRCIVQSWDAESGAVLRHCFQVGMAGERWLLRSIEDLAGQALDLAWDPAGRLLSVQQRLERRQLRMDYDAADRIRGVFLHYAGEQFAVATYAHDEAGRLMEAGNAAGFVDRFEYDDEGRIQREITKDGGVFHYRYDARGRCVRYAGLDHFNEKRLRYVDGVRVTEVTNSYGETWMYQHLPTGQATLEVDPLGARRTTAYDSFGRVAAKTDAMGATTRYAYDESGDRTAIIDGLGQVTRLTYSDQHQPLTLTDAMNQTWRRSLDASHRIVATTDPLGHQWRYEYDEEGNVGAVIDPKGARRSQGYRNGILQSTTDWAGNVTRFEFDAFGRVVLRQGALGERTIVRYDVMGNPLRVILPNGATLMATYDHAGNITRLIDGNGHSTRWRYGPCSRLMERIDPVGGGTRYRWGSERDRLDALINERSEICRFDRDEVGRIVAETGFDGAHRKFRLNAEGRCVEYTNANGTSILIVRDPLQRIVKQTLDDGKVVSFSFDPVGNLSSAVNAEISVSLERDPIGRIVREWQGDHWVASTYDELGNVTRTESSLGNAVRYVRDANGYASEICVSGHEVVGFERNAYGQELARHMPGGVRLEQRHDVAGHLMEQFVSAAVDSSSGTHFPRLAELTRRSYGRDAEGSVIGIHDHHWGLTSYAYDPAQRLISAMQEQGSGETFEYDAAANIVRSRVSGERNSDQLSVIGLGNRLLRKGKTSYEYDDEGRRIRKTMHLESGESQSWKYHWNVLDRLTAIELPDGKRISYEYDALGRRVGKATEGDPRSGRRFIWDRYVVLHEACADKDVSLWLFDGMSPLISVHAGRLYSIITDHVGSPRELVRDDGKLLRLPPRSAWGQVQGELPRSVGDAICPPMFPGQWRDDDSGLHYNFFRYYDPDSSVYISKDPLSFNEGFNEFAYARNPVNWIDPFGLVNASCASGERGRLKAKEDLKKAGFTVVAEEVTMKVGGVRIRADFVAKKGGKLYVFEVKNGSGRLTDNQTASGVFDMHSPANQGGGISTAGGRGTQGTLEVATDNRPSVGARGDSKSATFGVLHYDGEPGSRVD